MSSSAKKNHFLLLVVFVVFPLILAEIARSINEGGLQPTIISADVLKAMKALFIIFSIISFITPWLIYKGVIPFQLKQNSILVRINSEYTVLIVGYIYLFSPVIYGLVLFFSGNAIAEFYYYVGISVTGTLAWSFLNFRNPI